ncbi:MAG: 50S ribosomal protein L19 [Planctomycetes bacterium]|nr:50S ribosomal protein L19 [Planctomycetota bacterium]
MSGFAYEIEREQIKKTNIPVFRVGDSLDVHVRIKEGEKERIQIFSGICIARKGGGLRETFTVRRIVEGEGVERIFPVHSPNVSKIEVKRPGVVRRAKLYFLRDRVGKATRIKERVNASHLGKLDEHRNVKGGKPTEAKAEAKAEVKAEAKAEAKAEEKK